MKRAPAMPLPIGRFARLAVALCLSFQLSVPGNTAAAAGSNQLEILSFGVPPPTMCLNTDGTFQFTVFSADTGLPAAHASVTAVSTNLNVTRQTDGAGNVTFDYVARNLGTDVVQFLAVSASRAQGTISQKVEVKRCAWDVSFSYRGIYKLSGQEVMPVFELGAGKLHVELAEDGIGLTGTGYIRLVSFSYVNTQVLTCSMLNMSQAVSLEVSGALTDENPPRLGLRLKYPSPELHVSGGARCNSPDFFIDSMWAPNMNVGYDGIAKLLGSELSLPPNGGELTPVTFTEAILAQGVAGTGTLTRIVKRIYK